MSRRVWPGALGVALVFLVGGYAGYRLWAKPSSAPMRLAAAPERPRPFVAASTGSPRSEAAAAVPAGPSLGTLRLGGETLEVWPASAGAGAGDEAAFLLAGGERVVATGDLNVIPDPSVAPGDFEAAVRRMGLEIVQAATPTDEWWLIGTKTKTVRGIFSAANALAEAVPCRFVEPNLRREVKKRSIPRDPLFRAQWHLDNTGQTSGTAGADIGAVAAWDVTTGSPSVIVAVFDDGFDIGHADLPGAGALVSSRDFVRGTSNPTPADNDPKDPDNHGTSVWGLASAPHNSRGIAGVAPNVRYMLLRSPMEMDERATAGAIRWAADHGAHVMSNSWGYTDPGSVVKSALSYARKSGRGGKGTLVFFASGNEDADIGRTHDLSNDPSVLAIGATTHEDERTTYSNYGARLFAMAPAGYGEGVGLVSTDRAGARGYTRTSYTDVAGRQFDGTSGACPIAAGVAALVFSADPNRTADEVETILRETAEKVHPESADYDAAGRSRKYGFGRLDAAAAVARAKGGVGLPTPAIQGSVKNRSTDAPIASALVTLSSGPSSQGASFRFERLTPQNYTVTATADGFKSASRTVTLLEGQTRTVNLSLTPIPLPSIVVTVRKKNASGEVVFAQGVYVDLAGPTTQRARTGWGATAGQAKFYSLPSGAYTLSWGGHTGSVRVTRGQTAYLDLGP